jgi:hypothetical protein
MKSILAVFLCVVCSSLLNAYNPTSDRKGAIMTSQSLFEWKCQPKAETLLLGFLQEFCTANSEISALKNDLHKQTSTRLFDWIDHFVIDYSLAAEKELEGNGFEQEIAMPSYRVFHHPGAQLPRVVMKDRPQANGKGIAVSVESISDFLMVRGKSAWIEGAPLSCYRRCCVSSESGVSLWVVERRGTRSMEPTYPAQGELENYISALEKWQTRPRDLDDEDEAIERTMALAREIVASVGKDVAACIVLEGERKYWQTRNNAAQIQKNRQDNLGMGWANHDHHTFRSSRRHFSSLVRLFETLGFHCRERYYTGAEAGWGAQIMENSNCHFVLFLDVDLTPDEVQIDFAHHQLPAVNSYGTIGLWCALHGDSILKGGMHHLEAQFFFDQLTEDLGKMGIGMMNPFSSFPYLRQAFTKGQVWKVAPERIGKLLKQGAISSAQAEKFMNEGALGSHLENLQRREGYKGFNQNNVSIIIKETDPRKVQK